MKRMTIGRMLSQALLCALLILNGCDNAKMIEQNKTLVGTSEEVVTKASYESDYEMLWDTLKEAYPYLSYLRTQGIDVDGIYKHYAEETSTVTDEDKFYGILEEMFLAMQNFAHLGVLSPDEYPGWCDDENTDISPEYEPYYEVVSSPLVSERYSKVISSDYEKQVQTASQNEIYIQYFADCEALYIKIPSFATELVDRDKDIVYDNIKKYPETRHIIFDISGNGGGSAAYWMQNLVAPFGSDQKFSSRSYYKSSSIFEKYHAGLGAKSVSELPDVPEWVPEMGLDWYYDFTYFIPEAKNDEVINREIERWVLIGPSTYSSAETFTCFCKSTKWAKVVGMTTSGDGMHTSPVLLLLPKSGLIIRFSDAVGENPDGSINAIHGTTPAIPCKKGETALGRCLEEIRKKNTT